MWDFQIIYYQYCWRCHSCVMWHSQNLPPLCVTPSPNMKCRDSHICQISVNKLFTWDISSIAVSQTSCTSSTCLNVSQRTLKWWCISGELTPPGPGRSGMWAQLLDQEEMEVCFIICYFETKLSDFVIYIDAYWVDRAPARHISRWAPGCISSRAAWSCHWHKHHLECTEGAWFDLKEGECCTIETMGASFNLAFLPDFKGSSRAKSCSSTMLQVWYWIWIPKMPCFHQWKLGWHSDYILPQWLGNERL